MLALCALTPSHVARKGKNGMRGRVARHAGDGSGKFAAFDLPAAPILVPEGSWKRVQGGGVTTPMGFQAAGMMAGLRAGTKADLALVVSDIPAQAAGVFTLNLMAAAPVIYCKQVLGRKDTVRAVLINAGQANAATGNAGWEDSLASAKAIAEVLGVEEDDVLLESTGVIGKRIKMDALLKGIPSIAQNLGRDQESGEQAAIAITTTDLVSKSCALEVDVGGSTVRIGGMAKGSGMIHPNMATMLGVITCDAHVSTTAWRKILSSAVSNTFNQMTVDGDTSTNDTVIGLANGAAGGEEITEASGAAFEVLEAAVTAVCEGCAKAIAWDGEGATALVEVTVSGANTRTDANQVARSIAGSSLTKAAIFGHDPNWGRIACAAGYAGITFSTDDLRIELGPHLLMDKGQPMEFDAKAASSYLKSTCSDHGTVAIKVSIGNGPQTGKAWGCDLSYDYVKINAEYTT